jgi:hypothetical protein
VAKLKLQLSIFFTAGSDRKLQQYLLDALGFAACSVARKSAKLD